MKTDSGILLYPHTCLDMYCATVDFEKDEEMITEVLDELTAALIATPNALAIAAPQIGVTVRAFAYKASGIHYVINPELSDSLGDVTLEEGCLSVPGQSWYVNRPAVITLKGLTRQGLPLELRRDGLTARIWQHEVDHLNGTTVLERIPKPLRKQAERKIAKRNRRG